MIIASARGFLVWLGIFPEQPSTDKIKINLNMQIKFVEFDFAFDPWNFAHYCYRNLKLELCSNCIPKFSIRLNEYDNIVIREKLHMKF